MTQGDSTHDTPVGDEAADPERSGADVVAGVNRAAEGTPHGGVQISPEDAKPQAAPVEQARDDPAMTQGQVVDGPGGDAEPSSNPDPSEAGSGGAQSAVGARISDRESAGEEPPSGPPFSDPPG